MSDLPYINISPLPEQSSPVWALATKPPDTYRWPDIMPIDTATLVGTVGYNRQEAALWRRDETLRDAVNQIIANSNVMSSSFYALDGAVWLPDQIGLNPPAGSAARVDYLLDLLETSGASWTGTWSIDWDSPSTKLKLSGDLTSLGADLVYATNLAGTRGWYPRTGYLPTGRLPTVIVVDRDYPDNIAPIAIPPTVSVIYLHMYGGDGGTGGGATGRPGGLGGAGVEIYVELPVTGGSSITGITVGSKGANGSFGAVAGGGGGGGGGTSVTAGGTTVTAGGGGGGGGGSNTQTGGAGGAGGQAGQAGFGGGGAGGAAPTYGVTYGGGAGGAGGTGGNNGSAGYAGVRVAPTNSDYFVVLTNAGGVHAVGTGYLAFWWRVD